MSLVCDAVVGVCGAAGARLMLCAIGMLTRACCHRTTLLPQAVFWAPFGGQCSLLLAAAGHALFFPVAAGHAVLSPVAAGPVAVRPVGAGPIGMVLAVGT